MTRIPCLLIAASLFLLSHIGCASLDLPGRENSQTVETSQRVVRCLCLWQSVETVDAVGQPVRGFGGQVYFFTADSEEPVAVTGDVRVYVFDDVGTAEQQTRPKDIQNYDPLVWKSFQNESQVGTNYALFVPYNEVGKYEAVCSLRLRLVRPDGTQLFSDMATVKLTGESREDKSIRQLVSPREHSIRPDRSRELRVDTDTRSDSNSRVAIIGSIEDGDVSLSDHHATGDRYGRYSVFDDQRDNDRATVDRATDERINLQIQKYEAKLAEMHSAYLKDDARQQRPSRRARNETRPFHQELHDLMPAIREVSRENQKSHQRVTPTAHEVFSTEETSRLDDADVNTGRIQSAVWSDGSARHESSQANRQKSGSVIRTFSRPLRRVSKPRPLQDRSVNDRLQALQLARITDQ